MEQTVGQGRYFHGIILRDFLVSMDIEPTKENLEEVKLMFKRYFSCPSVSTLDESGYANITSKVIMLMAREFGTEVPESQAIKTMEELLKTYHDH